MARWLLLWWIVLHCGAAQFVLDSACYSIFSFSLASDCTVTCGTEVIDLSALTLEGSHSRVFTWSSSYIFQFIIPLCGSEPNFQSIGGFTPTPSWETSDIWQFTRDGTFDAFYLGSFSSSSWGVGTYSGRYAMSVSYLHGMDCSPYTANRQSTLYLVCNPEYSTANPSITISEPTTCNYEIVMEYDGLCPYSTLPLPTASPSSKEGGAEISRAAEVEVIISVLLIMFLVVGCYICTRKWCSSESHRAFAVYPTDGTYADTHIVLSQGENEHEDLEMMRPRLASNSNREQQRRLNQLYEQIQISAEQGHISTIVPRATVVGSPSVVSLAIPAGIVATNNRVSSSIPLATVVAVNGIRVER